MNPDLSYLRQELASLCGSLTLILTVLLLGFPERITETWVLAFILCFALWATFGRYWAWCVIWLWALFGGP
ncbi:MAG: hypothetical protein ACREYF_16555 [Gammaproteobacteria bacterium]